MWKIPKKIEKFENLKSCGSLDVNDGLGNFKETNTVNVDPKSTKLNAPILDRIELDLSCSLRDHFYPSQTSTQSCFDLSPIPTDVKFELNPVYIFMLPKFTGITTTTTTTTPSVGPAFAGSGEIQL